MKDFNVFLSRSKTHAMKRQAELAYCIWSCLCLLLLMVGVFISKLFSFDMTYLPFPVFITVGLFCFLYNKHFFQEKFIVRKQLKWLNRYMKDHNLEAYKDFVDEEYRDDSDARKAYEYTSVSTAIAELSDGQMVMV